MKECHWDYYKRVASKLTGLIEGKIDKYYVDDDVVNLYDAQVATEILLKVQTLVETHNTLINEYDLENEE